MMKMVLDQNWIMKDRSWDEYIPAFVPGDLYSDLLRNGKIEDPYYRDNELAALALSEREYEYVTTFVATEELLEEWIFDKNKAEVIFNYMSEFIKLFN